MENKRIGVMGLVVCAVFSVMFLVCVHLCYYDIYVAIEEVAEIVRQQQSEIITTEKCINAEDEIDARTYDSAIELAPFVLVSIVGMIVGFIMSCVAWFKGQRKSAIWGIGTILASVVVVIVEIVVLYSFA